jgi:hypothetical protein
LASADRANNARTGALLGSGVGAANGAVIGNQSDDAGPAHIDLAGAVCQTLNTPLWLIDLHASIHTD